MKSFRLDTSSIKKTVESWPAILIAIALCVVMAYFGWLSIYWRVAAIVFGAVYFGQVFRGAITSGLRAKYPNAKYMGLLSIGFTAATLGVLIRMTFPSLQGGSLDYAWCFIMFSTILAFLIINRHDPDVLK